ncbi:adenosylcobinamide-GDP ribazoletransferase [Nocardioides nitrophenolicus]|uniref:adenosylcobinamide-GDP ribazoletransferase n=1 Tax=Nocardioides nitrophenolicus TaxID=60489 RepID=UPI00195E9A36|nr:adenosylcobinamide-GDP ribazoletransferase [Nocardioides nitrophenolicus]MBM7519874.1 adenosylcobinamide-GDP ribazoletransferase [Nocardioides nitrophenolicus]
MSVAVVGRSLRLSIGMLTALRVPAVLRVSPGVATGALLLAPVAVLPLGAAVGAVVWAGGRLDLPALAVAFAALAALAVGSRALHLDGLSDVADGLTSSYDRERSLAVMKSGTAGPAGVAALVLVLGTQAAALTAFVSFGGEVRSAVVAGAAVCASRAALWLTACTLAPPARPDGLGVTFTRRVPVPVAVVGWAGLAALSLLVDPVRGPVSVAAAFVAVAALTWHAVRRFGGVTGDVFGAGIELALAVLLVGLAGA